MAGTPLSSFIDFFRTTGPLIFTGAEQVINEAQNRTYILSRILGGSDMLDMVQGGETIRDDIYFDVVSSYLHYEINEEFSYDNPQVLSQWSVPWRFTKADLVFTDQEIGLNAGELSRGAMFHQFKRLRRVKEQNLWTDICNGMELDLFATPSDPDMEQSTGKIPYSLFTFFNDFYTTIPTSDPKPTSGVPPGFTSIQGISPTTETRWRAPYETYADDVATTMSTIGVWDCFSAMAKMYYRLRFEPLPKKGEYGERSDPGQAFIMSSLQGIVNWEHSVRAAQDTFRGGASAADPAYPGLNFRGIPILYVEEMDFAEVWRNAGGTGFAAEFDGSTSRTGAALGDPEWQGPRYVWINPKYMRKVVKRDRFLHMEGPFSPSAQPFTRIMVFDTWHNNICRSRQRGGGVVGPFGNDITGP